MRVMGEVMALGTTMMGGPVTLGRGGVLLLLDEDGIRRRFLSEARTMARLRHPHIVTIFSIEEDAGVHFLTMELVAGRGMDCGPIRSDT